MMNSIFYIEQAVLIGNSLLFILNKLFSLETVYYLYRTSCSHWEQSIIYIKQAVLMTTSIFCTEQAVLIEYMLIHLNINYLKLEIIGKFKEECSSLWAVSQSSSLWAVSQSSSHCGQSSSHCDQSSSHCDQNANRRDQDPCGPEGGHAKLQLFPGSGLEGK